MSKKKNRKIIPYRRPHNLNVGVIIFGIIFLYMLFNIFAYFRRDKVQFYEVVEGGYRKTQTVYRPDPAG